MSWNDEIEDWSSETDLINVSKDTMDSGLEELENEKQTKSKRNGRRKRKNTRTP